VLRRHAQSVAALIALTAVFVPASGAHAGSPRFAPYLLATEGHSPDLVGTSRNTGARVINLGFVIGLRGKCTAAWDGTIPVRPRPFAARVSGLRAAGGDVQISFGGQGGVDLSRACRSDAALAGEYLAAIRAYGAKRPTVPVRCGWCARCASCGRSARVCTSC